MNCKHFNYQKKKKQTSSIQLPLIIYLLLLLFICFIFGACGRSEEIEIQKLVARMTGWKMAINSAIPCLVILFFGSWSDRHNRRKPCILVPLSGQIMMAFALLLCVYFENSPIEMAIFVEVFFPSITGNVHHLFYALQFK